MMLQTSKIVNVGIQYGGIEEAAPEVISEEDMENLLFFTDDDEQILQNYELVENEPTSYQEKVIKQYLGRDYNTNENKVYVLKDLEEEELESLVNLISEPLVEYIAVTNEETANRIKEQMTQTMSENMTNNSANLATGINLSDISVMDILKQMPEAQRDIALEEFTSYISQMSDSIKEQAAISSVKQVYINLGVDTEKLQNNYILMSGMQMLGIALISMVSAVLVMLLSSRVAAKLGKTLRDKVFKKVLSFSTAELREFSTASLTACP